MIEIYIWMLGIAIVFTVVGFRWGYKNSITEIVDYTIDELIEKGYLRTKSENGVQRLVKLDEDQL